MATGDQNYSPIAFSSDASAPTGDKEMHDIEAERALLGSLLLNADKFPEIEGLLSPSAFYVPRHQTIFEEMVHLSARGEGIDSVSIQIRLTDIEALERVGGREYLTELLENAPSVANIHTYARSIQEKHIRRQLQAAANTIATVSKETKRDIEEILDDAEKELFKITQTHGRAEDRDIALMVPEILEEIVAISEKGENAPRGIPTGYASIDRVLSGFHSSDLVILAARPSCGKTTLALDIARRSAAKHKTKVGILSLEMASSQLIERLLAAESKLDAWNMRTGRIKSQDDFRSLNDAADMLQKLPITIDDRSGQSTLSIRSSARKMKRERDIDILIIDYLQLIQPHETRRSDSLVQHTTEVSRSLKQIARELKIPVMALSQLSRDIEKRQGKPRLSDLRDSGSIEQDADVVMFLHRNSANMYEGEDPKAPMPTELLIEKHRNGPTGKVSLLLDRKHATFEEPASAQYEEAEYSANV